MLPSAAAGAVRVWKRAQITGDLGFWRCERRFASISQGAGWERDFVAGWQMRTQSWTARGLVLGVDKQHRIMTVSCETIPGYMDAMIMPIEVHETKEVDGLGRGALIEFSLVVGKENS